LSSRDIVNWFYGDEKRRYVEQIKESPLHFEADVCVLEIFLTVNNENYFSYGWLMGMCGQG
jgi:hypothetical protein